MVQTTVHMTGGPPKSIERPRPEPTALPTENIRVMRKTPTPATTPHPLPRWSLMEEMSETGDLMPSRTLMSVSTIMRMVDTTITQTSAYW
jgi:hypothetical protein